MTYLDYLVPVLTFIGVIVIFLVAAAATIFTGYFGYGFLKYLLAGRKKWVFDWPLLLGALSCALVAILVFPLFVWAYASYREANFQKAPLPPSERIYSYCDPADGSQMIVYWLEDVNEHVSVCATGGYLDTLIEQKFLPLVELTTPE